MRTPEELEQVAFKEALTADQDDQLVDMILQRSSAEPSLRKKAAEIKRSAFFAVRAFDKGLRDPEHISKYLRVLAEAQRLAPSSAFQRKLLEIKSVAAGKGSFERSLKKLGRFGQPFSRNVLATSDQLDSIETSLKVKLPPSYRYYLTHYAHRQIGTYEPFQAADLLDAVQNAWDDGLPAYLLPFLEDNADFFCFDLRSGIEEPPVVFVPHDGASDEGWANFAAWVEECWLNELDD